MTYKCKFARPTAYFSLLAAGALALSLSAPARADVTSYSTNFDSMSTGSIFGQEGWSNLNGVYGNNYVQGVTSAASVSGNQSWLLSSAYTDGNVCEIATPSVAAVGESLCIFGQTPVYNEFTESFWFRSVSATNDPSLYITNSLGAPTSVRNTFFAIQNNGSGSLVVDAIGTDATGQFSENPVTAPLVWGAWYQVKMDAVFADGAFNDKVNYQVLDSQGNLLLNSTINSWETYYTNNLGVEQAPGPIASSRVTWGLGGGGAAQGIYIDNFSESASKSTTGIPTSLAIPEPSTWAMLLVAAAAIPALSRRVKRVSGRR